MMLDNMKKILVKENPGHTITFKIEEYWHQKPAMIEIIAGFFILYMEEN